MTHPLHFFLSENSEQLLIGSIVKLSASDSHHVQNVLRLPLGSALTVAISNISQTATAELVSFEDKIAHVKICEINKTTGNARTVHTLLCGLCKPNICEEIIEHASELGVKEIIFFRAQHSQVKNNQLSRWHDKLARWHKIAETACKQCRRADLPAIKILPSLEDILHTYSQSVQAKFVLSLRSSSTPLVNCQLQNNCILAVGPEGDFTEQEYSQLSTNKFTEISLGNTVFRSQMAVIVGIVGMTYVQQINQN